MNFYFKGYVFWIYTNAPNFHSKQGRLIIETDMKSCITCASRCDQFGLAACTIAFCRVGCHGH